MTTMVIHQGDAYEISFTSEGIQSILRYGRCRDGRGELVDYKTISRQLQLEVDEKLERELKAKEKRGRSEPQAKTKENT
jgi:hypothetical protein